MFGKAPASLTKPLGLGAQLASSAYGGTIATVLGLARVAPILIWAANVRQNQSKGQSAQASQQPDYAENADFLLGSNPIYKILQLWSGGISGGAAAGQYGLTGSAGNVGLGPWPQIYSQAITAFGATTVVVPNPHLYYVLGVTLELTAGYNVNFNDYGAPGPVNLTGTMESLLWNTAYAGSNPTTQGAFQFWPWVYSWVPADGTTIHIPQNAYGTPWTGGTIRVYYVSLPANFYREPISWFALSFEAQLGEGSEYSVNPAQQIIYPHLAGMGSPQLDIGSAGIVPQLLPEVIAGPTVWPTGDCDFVDMISDVFRSGITQAGSTATQGFSKSQKGLNAYNYPAYIQKKFIRSSFSDGNNLYFDLPNTAGNFLICAAVGVTPSTSTISDSAGNVWTQAFTNLTGGIAGFSLWYCASAKAWPARNRVTITNVGIGPTGQFIGEVAGVDSLDIVSNGYQFSTSTPRASTVSATTTGTPGLPELLLGFLFSGDGIGSLLLDAEWSDEIPGTEGDVGFGVASRVVKSLNVTPIGSPSVSPFSVVQSTTYGLSATSVSMTATAVFPNPVTAGNSSLVAIWSWLNSAYSGPSDNQGNIYTLVNSITSGNLVGYLYLVTPTIAGSTTITVTTTASLIGSSFLSINASEVIGLLAVPLDAVASNSNWPAFSKSLDTGTVVTAADNELIFSTLECAGSSSFGAIRNPGDASPPTGYTLCSNVDVVGPGGDTEQSACAFRVVGSRGAYSSIWTNNNPFVGRGMTATFKIAAPSPAPQTGLYTFHTRFTSGDPNTWSTIIALKNSQAPPYTAPFGDILDDTTLDTARAQGRAAGLRGSIVMDSQQKASDWLTQFYAAADAAPVWSGFKLKTIPWSEVSAVGNGSIYTAPTASGPVANLSSGDMIGDSSNPVIAVERTAQIDVPNLMQIQYIDRYSQYNETLASEPETGAMALYGVRKDSPLVMRCIQDGAVARIILSIMIRRRNYIRNTYKFKLQAKWKLLEPMDLVLINDPLIGITNLPVRLTSVNEDEKYNLDVEAEPFIYGTHNPLQLTVTDASPISFNSNAPASQINTPIIFEAVPQLGTISGQGVLWILLSSSGSNYGGSFVYVSTDGGTSYNLIGTTLGNATTGYTVGDQPASADPDIANDLAVDLTESNGILASYTASEEDNFGYPIYLEPGLSPGCLIPYELETYAVATLTATSKYTLMATGGTGYHLRRAVYSAPQPGLGVDHPNGSRFAFLGNPIVPNPPGIVKLQIQPSWYHETIYFKFVPYNTLLGGSPPLSSVTAHAFTPCGPSFPPPVTGATLVEIPIAVGPSTSGNITIPHGLPAAPARVIIQMTSGGEIWQQSPGFDGTNLYLVASAPGVSCIAICFIAPATYTSIVPFSTSAPGDFSVAHGLGAAPVIAIPQYISGGAVWDQATPYDATNINLVASAAGVSGYLVVWSNWPTESIIRSPSLVPVVSTAVAEKTLTPGAPGNFTVAHGLGRTPVEAIIRDTSGGKIWWQSVRFDATDLYLESSAGGVTATVEIWY